MKRALKRNCQAIWHFVDGRIVGGAPDGVHGDLSGVRGDLSGVWGYLSGVRGDLSGVRGDLSGVFGDIDLCGLTDKERVNGVNVDDLICHDGEESNA